MSENRVLFIAHYFPPIGGAGVQRTTKFIKHLPSFGIEPVVLTGSGRSKSRWEPQESTLEADLPPELKVYRTGEPSASSSRTALLIEEGEKAIQECLPAVIFVTMSPFEDAEVASRLALRSKLPWIADLRDPWALDEFQVYRSWWHRRRELARMHGSLQSADRIVMNTPEAARRFREAFPDLASRVLVITNGYDADDFSGDNPRRDDPEFRIVHTGYLHAEQGTRLRARRWINRLLGRTVNGVEPLSRSHVYLLTALERWLETEPEKASRVKLCLAGVTSETDREIVAGSPARDLVEFPGFLPHEVSVALVRTADLLFLPMHGMPAGMRAGIVPGKTYEYIASGRPILAAVPDSDALDFLRQAGTARICRPDGVDEILSALQDAFRSWELGINNMVLDRDFSRRFERKELAAALAGVIADCQTTSGSTT